jgi:hypothetical protein
VDGLDSDLNTPLHCAIRYGHAAAARGSPPSLPPSLPSSLPSPPSLPPSLSPALVHELKADVNKRNRWGTTPLAEAVRLGSDEIADMLRDHGACLFLEIDSQQVGEGGREGGRLLLLKDHYSFPTGLGSLLSYGRSRLPPPSLPPPRW